MQEELSGKKFITLNVHVHKKKSKNLEPKHLATPEVRIANVTETESGRKSYGISQHFTQEQGRLSPPLGILVS